MRKWYNIELNSNKGKEFKELLKNVDFNEGFKYECSSCGDLIHFELYLEEQEVITCNTMLDLI